jgi:ribosomal protein S6--L-glutamate ligase/tetrahydromethanopterin:alpha-L-glutamate ligase
VIVQLKIGIVASDKEEWHVQRLMSSLKKMSIESYVFPPTRFHSRIVGRPRISVRGYAIEDFDAIIVRKVPGGTPEQVFYRMDALHRLEEMGVFVMNSADSIERSVDKFYTSGLLEDAGLRTPKTIITERFEDAIDAFMELGGDVVVKPMFGSLGFGMTRVSDVDVAYRVFRALEMINGVYYLQEFIPHRNQDIRSFVIGENVVASMLRTAKSWKTNIAGGGEATPYKLDDSLVEVSIKACKKIGMEYTGVDIMQSERDGGFYVVEVNSTPGWEALQSVTSKEISDILIDHLLARLR